MFIAIVPCVKRICVVTLQTLTPEDTFFMYYDLYKVLQYDV